MSTIDELKEKIHAEARAVYALKERAEAEDRDFTIEEDRQAQVHLGRIAEAKGLMQSAKDRESLLGEIADIERVLGPHPSDDESYGGSWPTVGSPAVKGRREDATAKAWTEAFLSRYGRKTLDTSGGITVPSPIREAVRDPERPRYVADLIPAPVAATGKEVTYFRQTQRDLNAGPWSPTVSGYGPEKPESNIGIGAVTTDVQTIAHVVDEVQRNDLADAQFLTGFIEAEMLFGLRIAIDDQLLNGSGSAPELEGILETSGIQTQAFTTDLLTTIRKARTKLQLAFFEPDAMVMHPTDAEALDLLKDGENNFYFAGPQASGASPVWSVRVVITPAIAQGIALMGDFAGGAQVFPREEARIDFSEALGFKQNYVTFRAETRLAFGVKRPLSFVEVDLTA